jgi:hypothetical protein
MKLYIMQFFPNLLSLHLSSVHISSSAHCSQILSVYLPPFMPETKFRKVVVFYSLIFTFLGSRQKFWSEW